MSPILPQRVRPTGLSFIGHSDLHPNQAANVLPTFGPNCRPTRGPWDAFGTADYRSGRGWRPLGKVAEYPRLWTLNPTAAAAAAVHRDRPAAVAASAPAPPSCGPSLVGAVSRPRLPGIEQRVQVFVQRMAGDADPATDADVADQPGMAHAADTYLMELPQVGHLLHGEQSRTVVRGRGPAAGRRHAGRARSRRRTPAAVAAVKRSAAGARRGPTGPCRCAGLRCGCRPCTAP